MDQEQYEQVMAELRLLRLGQEAQDRHNELMTKVIMFACILGTVLAVIKVVTTHLAISA